MTKTLSLFVLIAALILGSCQSKQNAEAINEITSEDVNNVLDTLTFEVEESDCPRGIPEPVVIVEKYAKADYRLVDDASYENIVLNDGDKLEIRNSGCEYYTLTFTYNATTLKADSSNIAETLSAFAALLKKTEPYIKSNIDMAKTVAKLEELKTNTPKSLEKEIVIEDGEIRHFAKVKQVNQKNESTSVYALDVSIGPF